MDLCSICDIKTDYLHECEECDFSVCEICYKKHGERLIILHPYINECYKCYVIRINDYIDKIKKY
jgi:hypothetical protein